MTSATSPSSISTCSTSLDLDSVHVVGQCIGGWVALEMAIRSTARIKSLVLVNSAGIRVKGVPRCRHVRLLGGRAAEAAVRGQRRRRLAEGLARDAGHRGHLRPQPRGGRAKYSWSPRLFNPKLERWLHRIDVPTHIVWGEEDRVIPPAYADALKDLIAGATVATLPGCAHLPHIEQPQAFASEVSQFIRRAAP